MLPTRTHKGSGKHKDWVDIRVCNMAAENNLEKDELKCLPMFDTTNVVNWS